MRASIIFALLVGCSSADFSEPSSDAGMAESSVSKCFDTCCPIVKRNPDCDGREFFFCSGKEDSESGEFFADGMWCIHHSESINWCCKKVD